MLNKIHIMKKLQLRLVRQEIERLEHDSVRSFVLAAKDQLIVARQLLQNIIMDGITITGISSGGRFGFDNKVFALKQHLSANNELSQYANVEDQFRFRVSFKKRASNYAFIGYGFDYEAWEKDWDGESAPKGMIQKFITMMNDKDLRYEDITEWTISPDIAIHTNGYTYCT